MDARGADLEDGRGKTLEMTPLTQANSLDGGGGDDDDGALAELLEGRLEESAATAGATATGVVGVRGGVGNAREATTGDAASRFGDSEAALLETGGRDAAGHHKSYTRFWQASRAPGGSSPPSRRGRGAPGFDAEAHRGVSEAGDGNRESGGGLVTRTNPDEGALERFDGEDQTTRSAIWRECLVPIKLLQEKRVRAILFVYGVYSVRGEESACAYIPVARSAEHVPTEVVTTSSSSSSSSSET